jgi:hypothetical protein
MSGDLELIDKDIEYETEIGKSTPAAGQHHQSSLSNFAASAENNTIMKSLVRNKLDKPVKSPDLKSTAEGVKVKLETQIKSILRNVPTANATASQSTLQLKKDNSFYNSSSLNMRSQSAAPKGDRNVEEVTTPAQADSDDDDHDDEEPAVAVTARTTLASRAATGRVRSASRQSELFRQVTSHSFKDIDLIKIESRIEPSELKDPVASAQAKIPVVKTRYHVNVLKKPYSMKWLRNRRLILFLQSELYNEFKLGMILAQLAKFNNDGDLILLFFYLKKKIV